MRVLAVQIWGHPGFGDLELDFSGSDGRATRLVVIAGENGCGKTAVLNTIFSAIAPAQFLAVGPRLLPSGRYRIMLETDSVNCSKSFLKLPVADNTFAEVHARWPAFYGIVIEMDGDAIRNGQYWPKYYRMSDDTICQGNSNSIEILGSAFGCFYSEANVSFDIPRLETIRTSAGEPQTAGVPPAVAFPVRGGPGLGAEVAQLLIDLQAADDREASQWLDNNVGRPPDEVRKRRIRRFAEAFAKVAPKKRYVGFETTDGEHRVIFDENGRRTALADLSTGEKQIVFRGAFLLRRAKEVASAVALIDEPELSLHPRWQENILGYYDHIAAEEPGKSNQLILATHSPFIVHGSPTAKHIVLRRNEAGVAADPSPSFPGAASAEVAVAAFELADFIEAARGNRLVLIVEGPTDRIILEEAWKKLFLGESMFFTIRSADGARNIPRLLGSGGGKSGPLLDALSIAGTALVGLFDFDQEGMGQWNGAISSADSENTSFTSEECQLRKRRDAPIWAALLPVPHFRRGYASMELAADSRLTIELLFPDEYVGHLLERVPVAGDVIATRLAARTDSQKQAVAAAVSRMPAEAFLAFQPIFKLISNIGPSR